jgi:peptidoglycan/xylan/chitin deacetylase (PgdA/CDA1 family)
VTGRAAGAIENLARGSYLRVVNFHNTPASRTEVYVEQLSRYARSHRSVSLADLDQLAHGGRWPYDRPGFLPVFFEGYRNNFEVALPILEDLSLTGWFYIPSAFHAVPASEQAAFAEAHHIGLAEEEAGARPSMTADEIRRVGERHVIAAHTATHEHMGAIATEEDVEREIVEPKRVLERICGRPVDVFAWLFAERYGINERCDRGLREAGYRWVVSHARLQKIG